MSEATTSVAESVEMVKLTEREEARFWAKVDKNGPLPDQTNPHYAGLGPCWTWTASVNHHGYGNHKVRDKTYRAHRLVYMMRVDPIPAGMHACHRCDFTSCVNPDHLWLGNPTLNCADKIKKGRANTPNGKRHGSRTKPGRLPKGDRHHTRMFRERRLRGERHPMAELSEAQVMEIRSLWSNGGKSKTEIARLFNVDRGTVGCILLGKTWVHIAPGSPIQHPVKKPKSGPIGEEMGAAKLTEDLVRAIRKDCAENGYSPRILAKKYNVSRSLIYLVYRRKAWKHVV